MFVIGFIWFGVWSLLVGISVYVNPIYFDFCRGMQGIGPAILLPNGIAILGTLYPPSPRKNMAFAMFGSVAPGGASLGAVFASLFAELLWWPWAYWAMAIACFVISVVGWAVIPSCPTGHDKTRLFQRLDGLGSLFGVGGLVLVNVAWNQGYAQRPTQPIDYTDSRLVGARLDGPPHIPTSSSSSDPSSSASSLSSKVAPPTH